MKDLKFETFSFGKAKSKRFPSPANMIVGQVVVRHNVKQGSINGLKSLMRKAMTQGCVFSIAQGNDYFAIRRDQ
jgi:hypothetical protein